VRADVSKRGVDDGNQKMGTLSSPQKRATFIIQKKIGESIVLFRKIKITTGNHLKTGPASLFLGSLTSGIPGSASFHRVRNFPQIASIKSYSAIHINPIVNL